MPLLLTQQGVAWPRQQRGVRAGKIFLGICREEGALLIWFLEGRLTRQSRARGQDLEIWCNLDFPGGSDGKVSAYKAGDMGSIPGREDLLEKEMATHSNILAWKSPWTEDPGRLQSMGSQRVRCNFTLLFLSLGTWPSAGHWDVRASLNCSNL